MLARRLDEHGPIDILVNNAGIIRRADAVDFTEADWDDVIDVNLKALFFLSQAFARQVIAGRPRGAHRQHRLAAVASRAASASPSYTAVEARRRRADPAARQRMGGQGHQRQRHRAGLHRDQQHRGAARRSRPQHGDPRPHPGRPLGRAVRHRRRRRLPARRRPTTCTAPSSPSTAAGWRAEDR